MKSEGWVGVSNVQNSKLAFKWFGKDRAVKNKALLTTWNPPKCGVPSPSVVLKLNMLLVMCICLLVIEKKLGKFFLAYVRKS